MEMFACRFLERIRTQRVHICCFALLSLAIATPAYSLTGAPESDTTEPSGRNSDVALHDRSAIPAITWKTAGQVSVWRTIRLGTFAGVTALLEALDSDDCGSAGPRVAQTTGPLPVGSSVLRNAPHCHLGESAGEIIGRPAFRLSRTRQDVDLVVLQLTELGFAADAEVTKESIYERAELLGFALCPAEAGAQLRLQYLDQPIGEFLQIAMEPVRTYAGAPTDLTVGNGGAGLVLIGGDGRPDIALPAVSRFVFVRPRPQH